MTLNEGCIVFCLACSSGLLALALLRLTAAVNALRRQVNEGRHIEFTIKHRGAGPDEKSLFLTHDAEPGGRYEIWFRDCGETGHTEAPRLAAGILWLRTVRDVQSSQ